MGNKHPRARKAVAGRVMLDFIRTAPREGVELTHVHSAVHMKRDPRDVGTGVGREEKATLRDVVDRTETAERNLRLQMILLFVRKDARHVGVDEARSPRS